MTITKFANGTVTENSSRSDALDDLREQYPEMVTHNDGQRTLVWENENDAENDDGQNAIAELVVT